MCFCRLCVSLCVCFSKSLRVYLSSSCTTWILMWWSVCARWGVPWGYVGIWETDHKKRCVWKRGWAIEGGREGSQLSVRYIIIWPCGFYRVVTWRTSLTDGIHFLYFTFPWTPYFTQCFSPTFSGSRLPSSSAPGAIRGGSLPLCLNCKDVTIGVLKC